MAARPRSGSRSPRPRRASKGTDPVARRGRPRSEASRRAILRAASQLALERDLQAITIEAVAERAGSSKATIYRWWPSKELLLLDALLAEWDTAIPEEIDTGSLAGDLHALVDPWVRVLRRKPYGRVIASFIASAQTDPRFAREYRSHFVERRREHAHRALQRALDRGEISADTDIEAALDLLYGPFYHRVLHGHARVTDSFAATIIDYVVTALSTGTGRAR